MKCKYLLLAAIAAIPVPALAQFKVGDDGRLLDANPRVGSMGLNSGPITESALKMGNRIITGNVTGGKEFHGFTGYGPNEFHGPTATDNMDRFIRGSAGSSINGQPARTASEIQPFYGGRVNAIDVPGFVRDTNGTYRPADAPDSRVPAYDPRIGAIPFDQAIALPSGDLVIPGAIDPITNRQTIYTASPLTGVRPLKPEEMSDRQMLQQYDGLRGSLGSLRLDDQTILRMQQEVKDAVDQLPTNREPNLAHPLPTPFDAPLSPLLRNDPLTTQIAPALLSADARGNPGAGARPLVAPAKQSTQYADLEQRLNNFYSQLLEGDVRFGNQIVKLHPDRAPAAAPQPGLPPAGGFGPTTRPAAPAQPDYAQIGRDIFTGPDPVTARSSPDLMRVASLADGVKAESLANLIKEGEELTREGKYDAAIAEFGQAQAVASNNLLILVGRAHAALGAGYFVKANDWLRAAMENDPVVFMGRFDLAQVLGPDRLVGLVAELKKAANTQDDSPALAFLLAYVAFHTGNARQAGLYLDLAESRAKLSDKNGDKFYAMVRSHWNVPTATPEPDVIPVKMLEAQIEARNVASLKYDAGGRALVGEFRKEARIPAGKAVLRFKMDVPAGSDHARLFEWIRAHGEGIDALELTPGN